MDFEIRHESATVLKPVVNAAARTLDHAQIELGPGGMRIWGNDKTRVAGLEIEIPADAFDTYEVEAGTFETSIDAWGDAIRGSRKTDPVAVYTEPNNYDSLRDVFAIGTNTKRVLRDKDLDSIEALEQARPEDLVGEVEYEGHNETKTAEIDMETAEEILFEVNGTHVVIESDGERQIDGDASDHPRVRKPKREFEIPGRNVAGSATVNGRDFSKAYRAISTVTDAAFVGITEGTLVLHGEGDTDEVHAAPDSEVQGGDAGGLYNGGWLSTLRLSLDRKASTDLTLHVPAADRGEEESSKHILWAEYAIGDGDASADVTWFLAPKIMGANSDDDDPETEADLLERVAPSKYSPASDVRFDVETTGGLAKSWFSVMDAKVDEAKVHLEPDGIESRFVDPANVMMQDVFLRKGAFESYTWRQPAGRLHDQERVIGLPLSRVTSYLKLFTKTEGIRFQVDEMARFVIIGENFSATMPTIDPDSVRREPDLPGLDLPGTVTVAAESFTDAVEACGDVADHVGLVMYDGECYVHADGDIEDAWVAVETIEGDGYASSLFSEDYLGDYLGSIPSGDTDEITMFGGREFPLFAEHTVGHPAAEFTLMLAPRIQSDEDAVVYGAEAIKENGMDPLRIKDADAHFSVNDDGEIIRSDDPDEEIPSTPEEAAEQVRDDDEDDGDVYDPTDEWDDGYGPTTDTPIPMRAQLAGIEGTGLAPSDLTREQHVTLDDGSLLHHDDREDPDKRKQFTETVAGIYDPSQDLEGDTDEFRASTHHRAGVPEEIGDWRLKAQVQEGRPVYIKDGDELRINRHHSTDVVHRRYYVEIRYDTRSDGVSDRDTLARELSPQEAMDALESEALQRSDNTDDDGEPDDGLVEIRSPYRPIPRDANKKLWDDFGAVESLEADDDGRGEGVLLPERPPQQFLDKYELEVERDPTVVYETPTDEVFIYTDPDNVIASGVETSMTALEAVEQAEDQDRFTLKSGDPMDVPGYDGSADDEDGGVYDPTDEFEELDEPSSMLGIGEGRRRTLDALDQKDRLDDPQSFDSLEEMKNAVREISLAHRDGRTYMAPPEDALNAIQSTWDSLPDEAHQPFLNDHRLYVKIRAARNRFNDWMGKKRREQEMPSPMEAGPSNYPAKKARKTAQYARDGSEDLTEAIGKIKSAANGAKQRALKAIGTSVGEQNEQKRQEKRENRRETFEKGDLAFWSDTKYGNALWGVKRVNKKSVRLRRPHGSAGMEKPMSDGEVYPEYDETRADLDKNRLKGPIPPEEIAAFDVEDTDARMSDDAIAVRADTADEARRIVFGDEWVEDNLDLDSDDSGTPAADQPWLDELDGIGSATYEDLRSLGLSNIGDAKEAYQDRAESDTFKSAWKALPSKEAKKSLLEAVGADPNASAAEIMGDAPVGNRLQGPPKVGQHLWIDYEDGGGLGGTVTRVEDDEALIRVSKDSEPERFDLENETVIESNGSVNAIESVEITEEDATDMAEPDSPTGGYDAPGSDDLQSAIAARGVNNIVASNLSDQYDSLEQIRSALADADRPSDLHGIGEASEDEVADAFDVDTDDGGQSVTSFDPETEEAESYIVPDGVNGWQRQEDAPPTRGGAVWINPHADDEDYLHVTKTGSESYLVQRNTGEKGDYEIENVGTRDSMKAGIALAETYMGSHAVEADSGPTGDREVAEEHRRAVEAARDTDPDADLPGPALSALKKNWSVYKRGIKEGREAVEEAEEYRTEHRQDAEEAAAIINDIRAAYGQEPIDFEGVEGIPEIPELGGPITQDDPNVSISFDWSADPYDPTEDL